MRVHLKNDRLVNNVLVGTAHLVSQVNNVVSHLLEVSELLALDLVGEDSEGSSSLVHMVETQLKRSSSDDTVTTGQEIKTHNRLKNGRFTSRLRTKHGDSWQINILLQSTISKFVNNVDELFKLVVHKLRALCRLLASSFGV